MNTRENRMGNQEWTIQRYCQYLVHKAADVDDQNTNNNKYNTENKTVNQCGPHFCEYVYRKLRLLLWGVSQGLKSLW